MIWLGLGSNLGNKKDNIQQAIQLFSEYDIDLQQEAGFYETPPWGITTQPAFINTVCEVLFDGPPEELLKKCQQIEWRLGRKRELKWGPRVIDIDILEFREQVYVSNNLILPHPFYTQRAFVLVPMAELIPGFIPTGQYQSIRQLLDHLPHQTIRRVDRDLKKV